jgi:GNAT superfamily N-acetyltransferase
LGHNTLRVEVPAALADFHLLPMWYELAGVACEADDAVDDVAAYQEALTAGVLGAAVGNNLRKNLETLISLEQSRWHLVRMAVRVLKLNGEQIGIVIMGSHQRLWQLLGERMSSEPIPTKGEISPGFMNYMATILSVAKIHVVAVHPDHRGRGHGARLLRHARSIATSDGLTMLYGQFSANRPRLQEFYTSNGFQVLAPGAPLAIGRATGRREDFLAGPHTERFFSWIA